MNLRGQLNNMSIQNPDGTITNLGEKYGKKPELQTKQNYKDYEALMQRER